MSTPVLSSFLFSVVTLLLRHIACSDNPLFTEIPSGVVVTGQEKAHRIIGEIDYIAIISTDDLCGGIPDTVNKSLHMIETWVRDLTPNGSLESNLYRRYASDATPQSTEASLLSDNYTKTFQADALRRIKHIRSHWPVIEDYRHFSQKVYDAQRARSRNVVNVRRRRRSRHKRSWGWFKKGIRNIRDFVFRDVIGVATDTDTQSLKKTISESSSSLFRMYKNSERITVVVNRVVALQAKLARKEASLHNVISQQTVFMKKFRKVLRSSNTALRVANFINSIDTVLKMTEGIMHDRGLTVRRFERQRQACEHGHLTAEVLPPTTLKRIMTSTTIKAGHYPMRDIHWYYQSVKVDYTFEDATTNTISCKVHLPLVEVEDYIIFTIRTFPTVHRHIPIEMKLRDGAQGTREGDGLAVRIHHDAVVASSTQSSKIFFPEQCVGHSPMACKSGAVYRNVKHYPCLRGLVLGGGEGQVDYLMQCELTAFDLRRTSTMDAMTGRQAASDFYSVSRLATNEHLLYVAHEEHYTYMCKGDTPLSGILSPGTYLVKVRGGCVLDADEWMLSGEMVDDTNSDAMVPLHHRKYMPSDGASGGLHPDDVFFTPNTTAVFAEIDWSHLKRLLDSDVFGADDGRRQTAADNSMNERHHRLEGLHIPSVTELKKMKPLDAKVLESMLPDLSTPRDFGELLFGTSTSWIGQLKRYFITAIVIVCVILGVYIWYRFFATRSKSAASSTVNVITTTPAEDREANTYVNTPGKGGQVPTLQYAPHIASLDSQMSHDLRSGEYYNADDLDECYENPYETLHLTTPNYVNIA